MEDDEVDIYARTHMCIQIANKLLFCVYIQVYHILLGV